MEERPHVWNIPWRPIRHEDDVDSDISTSSGSNTATDTSGADGDDARARKERLEWHSMFTSVVQGEIFGVERTRVYAATREDTEGEGQDIAIWIGVRARLHGRTLQEEKTSIMEKRAQLGDEAIEAILRFQVSPEAVKDSDLDAGFAEVQAVVGQLLKAKSYYPNHKRFYEDRPAALESSFIDRRNALYAWSSLVTSLRHQRSLLRTWMDESADKHITTPVLERPPDLRAKLVDRMLKDDSLARTFEQAFLSVVPSAAQRARSVQISLATLFQEMRLPRLEDMVSPLVSFPLNLMQSLLRSHIDHVHLVRPSTTLIVDELSEQLRNTIGLACAFRTRYEPIYTADDDGCWELSGYPAEPYDEAVLDAVKSLFQLMQWKLRLSANDRFFQETDLLNSQWDLFNDISKSINGGSLLVAEQLCMLATDALRLATSHLRSQMPSLPPSREVSPSPTPIWTILARPGGKTAPPQEAALTRCRELMENLRVRYWKLGTFVSRLGRVVNGCAEYFLHHSLEPCFISALVDAGHCLVDSDWHEEHGILIIASPALYGQDHRIACLLAASFIVESDGTASASGDDHDYLLLWSPAAPIAWPGATVYLQLPAFEIGLRKQRLRLVAAGAGPRLHTAKGAFMNVFETARDMQDARQLPRLLRCVDDSCGRSQAVNRRLRALAVARSHLARTVTEAVVDYWTSLRGSEGSQPLLGELFAAAAKHAQVVKRSSSDASSIADFILSWITLVMEDADAKHHRTLEWMVQALDFTGRQTQVIVKLSAEEFKNLRVTVGSCMNLLVEHYDVGSVKKYQHQIAIQKQSRRSAEALRADTPGSSSDDDDPLSFKERTRRALVNVEMRREQVVAGQNLMGRVLDRDVPEDHSIVMLASAKSNLSMNWQQGRHLGTGASGSVHLAVDMESGSVMAVKEISFQHHSAAGVADLQRRFKNELDVMEMLRHPNIVDYYGVEVHRDKVFIFEEYCEGGSLEDLLAQGAIEEQIVQIYALQMLEGLAYLHASDIAHRDVKPGNILLDRMGVLKFVDFGAAAVLTGGQRTIQNSLTPRGSLSREGKEEAEPKVNVGMTGTPMYMAPEVIKNQSDGGQLGAMDVWSVGCVVLRCVTGRQPWPGLDHEWSVMFHIAIATQPPPLPDSTECSASGIAFIRACVTISAAKRPSAQEMLDHAWMWECREMLSQYEDQPAFEVTSPTTSET